MSIVLKSNESLYAGEKISSDNGFHYLTVEEDGNVVLYSLGIPVWKSNTGGNEGAYLAMQADGNLVIYTTDRKALWHTDTYRAGPSDLHIQDDRNLVVYDRNMRATWSSETYMPAKFFEKAEFEAPPSLLPRAQAVASPSAAPMFEPGIAITCVEGTFGVCVGALIVIAALLELEMGDPPFGPNNDIRVIGREIDQGVREAGSRLEKAVRAEAGNFSDYWKQRGAAISDWGKDAAGKVSDAWKDLVGI